MRVEAGLVRVDEMFFDSIPVKADADRGSLVPRLEVVRPVEELFGDAPEAETPPEPPRPDAALPTANDPELKAANASRDDFVSSAGRRESLSRLSNLPAFGPPCTFLSIFLAFFVECGVGSGKTPGRV